MGCGGDVIAGGGYFWYLTIGESKLLDIIARGRYFGYLIVVPKLPRQ